MGEQPNNVKLDFMIDSIFKEYESSPYVDIFEIINEVLDNEYSLDDIVDYIQDKTSIKKRFYKILVEQNYNRDKTGLMLLVSDNIQDLI